jgi:hypothetical protein
LVLSHIDNTRSAIGLSSTTRTFNGDADGEVAGEAISPVSTGTNGSCCEARNACADGGVESMRRGEGEGVGSESLVRGGEWS